MIEEEYIQEKRKKMIMVINEYKGKGKKIWGEDINEEEYEDMKKGKMMMKDMVERKGINVFERVKVDIKCKEKVLREKISVKEMGMKDFEKKVKMEKVKMGEKLIKLREEFDEIEKYGYGEI